MSVDSVSISDRSDESSLESRSIKLKLLGEEPIGIPKRIAIHSWSSYGDVVKDLAAIDVAHPVILEANYGPKPYWDEADPNVHIEVTCQTLYVVNAREDTRYTLGVVRTTSLDYPIAIFDPGSGTGRTILEAIFDSNPGINNQNMEITGYSGGRQLMDELYDHETLKLEEGSTFPTVFFITQRETPVEFQPEISEEMIPPFLQSTFIQCKHLTHRAYDLEVPSLQVTHLSTCLLHEIICVAKAFAVVSSSSEDDGGAALDILETVPILLVRLQGLLDRIDQVMQSLTNNGPYPITIQVEIKSIFDGLCGNLPGAVTVRCSHASFEKMGARDRAQLPYTVEIVDPITTPTIDMLGEEPLAAPFLALDPKQPVVEVDSTMETNPPGPTRKNDPSPAAKMLDLQVKALENLKESLGYDHPDTLVAMRDLASTYNALGLHSDAKHLQEPVLKWMVKKLGDTHTYTLVAMRDLASTYNALRFHSDAKHLQELGLKWMMKKLGDTHADTFVAMRDLASTYNALGFHSDAKRLQEAALEGMMEKLGDTHADTLITMLNLSVTYSALGPRRTSHDLHGRLSRGLRQQEGQPAGIFAAIYKLALTYRTRRAKKMVLKMRRIQEDISARKPVDYNVAELFEGIYGDKGEANLDVKGVKLEVAMDEDEDMDSDAIHSDMEVDE